MANGIRLAAALVVFATSSAPAVYCQETGSIRGRVVFEGDPPERRRIHPGIVPPEAEEAYPGGIFDEALIVGEGGAVRNVLVRVRSGLEGREFTLPRTAALLEIERWRFEPHVVVVRTGQPLIVRNRDETLHIAEASRAGNRDFHFVLRSAGDEGRVDLAEPEVAIRVSGN